MANIILKLHILHLDFKSKSLVIMSYDSKTKTINTILIISINLV